MKRIVIFTFVLIFALQLVASASVLQDTALQSPGSTASDWSAIALLVSGEDFDKSTYISGLKGYVTERYLTSNALSPTKATEWHRIALAVALAGEDPTSFAGINLINDGIFYRENLGRQGINGYIWALITIASGNYSEPVDAVNTVDDIIQTILSKQNADGSFSLKAGVPDCDITAMAICALSEYKSREGVSLAINNAINYLSLAQNPDGSFSSNGIPNAESTAQVIIALSSLGYDVNNDTRFPNLLGALQAFRTQDGYSHTYGGETDAIATYQAVCASVATEKKCLIYKHSPTSQKEIEYEEPTTEKLESEIKVYPTEDLFITDKEEEPTTPQATEVVTSEQTEVETENYVAETSENNGFLPVFVVILIVFVVICGIIIRRTR